jgi:hypothetical protein
MSKADLARSLGKEPSQITRWLGSTGNLTLETLSDLLFATSGCLLELNAVDPFVAAKSNHQAISGYINLLATPSNAESHKPKPISVKVAREERPYKNVGQKAS